MCYCYTTLHLFGPLRSNMTIIWMVSFVHLFAAILINQSTWRLLRCLSLTLLLILLTWGLKNTLPAVVFLPWWVIWHPLHTHFIGCQCTQHIHIWIICIIEFCLLHLLCLAKHFPVYWHVLLGAAYNVVNICIIRTTTR